MLLIYINLIPKKRGRYSNEYKTKVLLYAKHHSSEETCEKYKIDRRRFKEWEKKSDEILKMKFKLYFQSCNEKRFFDALENRLHEWINEKRALGACLSGLSIKQKSLEFHKELYETNNFKGSTGWFLNFCKRRKLTLRRVTSTGRECLPTATTSSIVSLTNVKN